MNSYSYFLFARPSFLEGVARLFDFGHTLSEYNESVSPAQADYIAIASDWQAVGQDLRAAIRQFESESREGVTQEPSTE